MYHTIFMYLEIKISQGFQLYSCIISIEEFLKTSLEIKYFLITQVFYNTKFGGYLFFICEVQIKPQKCQGVTQFSF